VTQEENGRRGKKKRRKASGPAGKEMGQQAKMKKEGGGKEFPFLFPNQISKFISK